jgi:hypothetical protein
MAEFVQQHLEELLPTFTALQRTKILSDEEVKTLIQKVRQFEYSVNKRTKRPKDYLNYAEYLSDLLELVSIRRKSIDFKQKRDEIEKPLKMHAAHLFRICSERFKKAEYYQKEIDFLSENELFHILTKTFTRFLQFHGSNPRNHEQAGRWEYFENKSAENARVIFQLAVRKFPKDIGLWVAFIEMEIAYVVMLFERRARLTSTDIKTEDENETLIALEGISDAVFEFKLVEIVLNQGMEAVENKNELLFECYKVAHKYGKPAEKAAEMFYNQLWPQNLFTDDAEGILVAALEEDEKFSKVCEKLVELRVNEFLDNDEKERNKNEANEIMDLLDQALENVPPKEALPIWECLIDFSIAYFPLSFVDKVFEKAFIEADTSIVDHLKAIKSDFTKALKESKVKK